ncbi:MAG: disulfide bond formation protein DsbA [Rubrivivax sp. SCN 71-131]|jgi:2-hydroxychromene-2-carboxylate isomerase|nr:MAG: disulfide bond formation protein DsbA [Rubrivivax sp. SCN 71-131]
MKRIDFWFDPLSPFTYLAFERLPEALQGLSHEVVYRPALLAALLQQHGSKGPAEVEPKRAWTFRHVHWLAHRHRIPMDTPALHPFNPLPLLRLALACGPNRRVVEAILRHVWRGGEDASDPARLVALRAELAPSRDPEAAEVKDALRASTAEAIAQGVFGVPSFGLDGRLFWGLDALPMLADALRGDAWFEGPAWAREGAPRAGVQRR